MGRVTWDRAKRRRKRRDERYGWGKLWRRPRRDAELGAKVLGRGGKVRNVSRATVP